MDNYISFISQVKGFNVKEVIEHKTYLTWHNTEDGRDVSDCYERIEVGNKIYYVNTHNRDRIISIEHSFFKTLEEMYNNYKLKNK